MNTKLVSTLALALLLSGFSAQAELSTKDGKKDKAKKDVNLLREIPASVYYGEPTQDSSATMSEPAREIEFKPNIQVGAIVHMFASYEQSGFGPGGTPAADDADTWNKGMTLYRARFLFGGQLSKNGSFFMETEIPSPIGIQNGDTTKNVKVAPIILDALYEHKLSDNLMVIAGMMLMSHNRNGLQGTASLMANDFTYFQYPYNLFENSPLQGNFGRDLGVNFRGFLLEDKLEYRIGAFTGRNTLPGNQLRYVGRVVYNFLDPDKDFYYAGTKLGVGKTIALGAGFDVQGTYNNVGADLFVDVPLGDPGSLTVNAAFSAMTGGTDTDANTSFARLIPKQTTQFLEVGYYFKDIKIQPWIRYERQAVNADGMIQTGGKNESLYNDLNSTTVLGGGVNYWFAGYNTNLRLSYTTWTTNIEKNPGTTSTETESKTFGQLWLQAQFFIF